MHFYLSIYLKSNTNIASARNEFLAPPDSEWRKDYFDENTGGYVATHVFKDNEINVFTTKYSRLLKYRANEDYPRGYPDAYFNGQTWDFKKSEHRNIDSIRKLILDGRKADNVVFIIEDRDLLEMILRALKRELGNRKKRENTMSFQNVYYLFEERLCCLWNK